MEVLLNVTTTGSAGSATGSTTTTLPVVGYLEAIHLDFHASAPATTDTTITEVGGPGRTLLTLTNTVTDASKYVRVQGHDTTGAAITGVYDRMYLDGCHITVALAQCDALTNAVVVRLTIVDEDR